jgi:hypothetical protein
MWTALRLAVVVVLVTPRVLIAAEAPHEDFARSWEGRQIVVKQALYTLVYNERGKLGNTHTAKRDGLTVVTPHDGVYLQFDGRQGRDSLSGRDPQGLFDAVSVAYRGNALEVRSYRKVEPLLITRYDPGAALVVRRIRVERDTVRFSFVQADGPDGAEDAVTSLTVKWPVPLSKSFSERPLIEQAIRAFVDLAPAP